MLGVFAEFETNLRRERQLEGIAKAKAEGVYAGKGRPAKIDTAKVREMKAPGRGATEIAEELARLTQFATKCERNQWRHLKSLHYSEGVFQVPRGFSLAEDVRGRSLLSIPVIEHPLGLHYIGFPATRG
jgi:hypothetical protein